MINRFDVSGKNAFITGSTSGIGKALAKGLIDAGCNVWIHGMDEKKCNEVAVEVNASGWIAADLRSKEDIHKMINQLLEKLTRLDILINNAGIEKPNGFENFNLDIFDETIQVNLRAPIILTHGLLPVVKRSKHPSIINITSIHQNIPYPNNLSYSISKAALAMFTKVLTVELAPKGFKINNFAPGAVLTNINREVINENKEQFENTIPIKRVATTDEMVGTILYLSSEASSYLNGVTITVDGGYSLNLVRYQI